MQKLSSLKDKFIFRDGHQGYDETAYLLKSPKNAIRLLESMESLKEGKIIETSLSELPHKYPPCSINILTCL